jgi:NADPH:quinone reductase-like Zn-dependent oxidoreductase
VKAIVITAPGGPEMLAVTELSDPVPAAGEILVRVAAFGLNHAEAYMRSGAWGKVAQVPGVECAGTVEADPSGRLAVGTPVVAILGGMGRTRNGSYAELVTVPASNVVPVSTSLSWTDLGTASFPLADIPLRQMIGNAETGRYQAKPVRVFGFDQIVQAHRVMEEGQAVGKMVVAVS